MRGISNGAASLIITAGTALFVIFMTPYSQTRQAADSNYMVDSRPPTAKSDVQISRESPSLLRDMDRKSAAPVASPDVEAQTVQRNVPPPPHVKTLKDISKQMFVSNLAPKKYKQGKTIIYESLYKCERPQFLKDYRSPCWESSRYKGKTFCAPRIVLVGFHKCGTTDSSKWFRDPKFGYANTDFFLDKLGDRCPRDYMEIDKRMTVAHANMTTFGDCPGCLISMRILREGSDFITVHSIFQYLQFLRKDNTKYIATIRNPTDRFLSHYFYVFQSAGKKNISIFKNAKTPEDIGYDVLHEAVAKTVTSLTSCLENYGITDCIISGEKNDMHEDSFVFTLITYSCYSVFIREALKFIPQKLIYFSRMEDYAAHPETVVPEIFKFVGEDASGIDLGLSKKVVNKGRLGKPVHQKTIDLLDNFFQPFNDELAEMLGDNKWKYVRESI